MDIRIKVDPTYEEFYHVNMLMIGRTGFYKYASPAIFLLFLFLGFIAMVISFLDGIMTEEVLIFFFVFGVLLTVSFAQYILFPRRIKKQYLQSKNISGVQEYRFTENSVAYKDERGESAFPWGKFIKWLEDDTVLVLFQTDNTISLFPKRCFSQEQMIEIRQAITAAKIPVHKIRHIMTILWMVLVLFVMTPIACLLVALTMYNFFLSLAGY